MPIKNALFFYLYGGDTMDIHRPVTNPALLAAIHALQNDTNAEATQAFVRELKQANLLLPVVISPIPTPDETGKTILKQDTALSPISLETEKGEPFLIVFTDWAALRQWRNIANEQTLVSGYEDICCFVHTGKKYKGFAINPMSDNMVVTTEQLEQFNRPTLHEYQIEKETKVTIGIPAEYPHELVSAVSAHLKTQKCVKRAYLVLMMKSEEKSLLMVIDHRGDRRALFDGIAAVAVPLLKEGQLLDMLPLEGGIGQDVAKGYAPFYHRNLLSSLFP